jgi:hypothetical protein
MHYNEASGLSAAPGGLRLLPENLILLVGLFETASKTCYNTANSPLRGFLSAGAGMRRGAIHIGLRGPRKRAFCAGNCPSPQGAAPNCACVLATSRILPGTMEIWRESYANALQGGTSGDA